MSNASPADRRLAEIAILVVMVLWAGNFIVVKSAVALLPPIGFTFLRFLLASITLLVLLRWREGSFGLPRRDVVPILALGALGFGIYQMLWTTGLTTVAAGDSALIIAATPVLVALLAVVARSDVLTPVKLAGVLISFAGVAIVIASGPGLSLGGSLVGEAVTFAAAICWSIYMAFGGAVPRPDLAAPRDGVGDCRRNRRAGPDRAGPARRRSTARRSRGRSAAVLYAGLLPPGISNVIVQNGVKVVGPTRTAALQFLVPALAVVLAATPARTDPAGPGDRRERDRRRRPAHARRRWRAGGIVPGAGRIVRRQRSARTRRSTRPRTRSRTSEMATIQAIASTSEAASRHRRAVPAAE